MQAPLTLRFGLAAPLRELPSEASAVDAPPVESPALERSEMVARLAPPLPPGYTVFRGGTFGSDTPGPMAARYGSITSHPVPSARMSSDYGMRTHPVLGTPNSHSGVDYAAPAGTPIYAVADGKVIRSKMDDPKTLGSGRHLPEGWDGHHVIIKHDPPIDDIIATSYSHMSRRAVRAGQRVKAGDLIGYVGKTGMATGNHLHWMAYKKGWRHTDPKVLLPESRAVATIASPYIEHPSEAGLFGALPPPIPMSSPYGSRCPVCSEPALSSCRCHIGDKSCKNRHTWFKCPQHGTRIIADGDTHAMNLPRGGCYCRHGQVYPPDEAFGVAHPVPGARLTSGYAVRKDPHTGQPKKHSGLDLAAATGTPVYAMASGTVTTSRMDDPTDRYPQGYDGNYIIIKHDDVIDGIVATSYSHLDSRVVQKGQHVNEGDLIGYVGETGKATGPHLHLMTYKRQAANPRRWEHTDPSAFLARATGTAVTVRPSSSASTARRSSTPPPRRSSRTPARRAPSSSAAWVDRSPAPPAQASGGGGGAIGLVALLGLAYLATR